MDTQEDTLNSLRGGKFRGCPIGLRIEAECVAERQAYQLLAADAKGLGENSPHQFPPSRQHACDVQCANSPT
jgi:hypothetical protein